MLEAALPNQILAILFVAKEPLTLDQLQEVYPDTPVEELQESLDQLISEFNSFQRAVEIRQVGGGYRMTTRPNHHEDIRNYLKTKPSAKLSLAALETLAVVAYKQPVTLPEIMDIRGIKGTSTIHTLLEKKLIEPRGRKKVVGRPIMYGTAKEFTLHFGLKDLSELPTLEELQEVLTP
ncbi:MAG: SMC-Scp complex subunit ScpB [Acidobacteria bacterium]|nr:SMC-Scp complex subunit ScpB [Acidobacteriota bacterium]